MKHQTRDVLAELGAHLDIADILLIHFNPLTDRRNDRVMVAVVEDNRPQSSTSTVTQKNRKHYDTQRKNETANKTRVSRA